MIEKQKTARAKFADLLAELEQSDGFYVDAAKVELSEQICQAMQNKNVSEAELARRLNVSRAYVNKILQGNVNFTIETLIKIARALENEFEFRFIESSPKAKVSEFQVAAENGKTAVRTKRQSAKAVLAKNAEQAKN